MMRKIFSTPKDSNFFGGYYDKSLVSPCRKYLLALCVDEINKIPDGNQVASVGVFFLEESSHDFKKIIETRAYNWQQGSMLRWSEKFPDCFYVNTFAEQEGEYKTLLVRLDGAIIKTYPALYEISRNEKYGFSLDFSRLYWFRSAYSYGCIRNPSRHVNQDHHEEIIIYEMESGEKVGSILIKSVQALVGCPEASSITYMEHLMCSPDSKKLAFLYREKNKGIILSHLLVFDLSTEHLKTITHGGRVSHFAWRGVDQIVAWAALRNSFNHIRQLRIFKPMMPFFLKMYHGLIKANPKVGNTRASTTFTGDSYILINVNTGKAHRIGVGVLNCDGHPTFSPNNNSHMLTDKYPNKLNNYSFFLFNLESEAIFEEVKYKSDSRFDDGPCRCDLHPKWDFQGRTIAVDWLVDGRRGMDLYEV